MKYNIIYYNNNNLYNKNINLEDSKITSLLLKNQLVSIIL